MAGLPLQKLSELEHAMVALAEAQLRTEANLDRLEANLDRHAGDTRANLDRHAANLDRLEKNLDRHAAESRANLDRHAAETRANLDRLEANLDRYAAETRTGLDRLEKSIAESNRQAGEAVNRVGRLVEDIVAPTLEELFEKLFPTDGPVDSAIRLKRGKPRQEFDAYAAGTEHLLLLSVKGTLAPEHVTGLLNTLARIRDFFPEAANRKVHGALASLYVDESVVTAAERRGLFVIGLRPGITTLLNSEGFEPATF